MEKNPANSRVYTTLNMKNNFCNFRMRKIWNTKEKKPKKGTSPSLSAVGTILNRGEKPKKRGKKPKKVPGRFQVPLVQY